jgi:hypothetical protein
MWASPPFFCFGSCFNLGERLRAQVCTGGVVKLADFGSLARPAAAAAGWSESGAAVVVAGEAGMYSAPEVLRQVTTHALALINEPGGYVEIIKLDIIFVEIWRVYASPNVCPPARSPALTQPYVH